MNKKVILNKFLDILEDINGIRYTKEFTRERLIRSLLAKHPYIEYGVKNSASFSKSIRRNLLVDLQKPNSRKWDIHFLYLMGYKECSICSSIKLLSEFYGKKNQIARPECIVCSKHYKTKHRNENKEEINKKARNNYVPEKQAKKWAKYYQENKIQLNAKRNGIYNERVKIATPKWADLLEILDFYTNRPEGYHVDHIIPLKGEKVCGLHVIDNLQYLSAVENLRKSNKFKA